MSDRLDQEKLEHVKAQIPHREPFLFVDAVLERGEGRIVTQRLVRAEEPHFQGHYPGSPLMPGVLLCEACFQTGAMLLSDADLRSAEVGDVDLWSAHGVDIRWRGRLPHWERDGGTYFVTWRLADSLPQSVLQQIVAERDDIRATAKALGREITDSEAKRLEALHTEKIEGFLHAGHGSCAMADPRCAKVVADALKHFDGERYDLHAWCVMPNHVHVVFRARPGHELHRILQSWKTFTARECNVILGRSGQFWMDESFDRLVRDEAEHARFVAYTLANPENAGLRDWPWVGVRGADQRSTSPTAAVQKSTSPTAADRRSTSRPVLTRILEAKFRGMVRPGDLMRVEVVQDEKMGDAFVMSGRVDVAGKNVLRVKFIVAMVDVQS